MTTPRYRFQIVLLYDGTVLAAGGVDNNFAALASFEVYNPDNKTWAATTGPMTTPRSQFQMVLLSDGTVLTAGGNNNGVLAYSEVYNPATETREATIGPMTTPRYVFQMVLLIWLKGLFRSIRCLLVLV